MANINDPNHLKKVHKKSPLSDYVYSILYGGSDGVITTLAVVSGFAGAKNSSLELGVSAVLLFGFANLFADAASMGLGNYLGARSEKRYIQRQNSIQMCEISKFKDHMLEHTQKSFNESGFNPEDSKTLTRIISSNYTYWQKVLAETELGMDLNKLKNTAWQSSLITFISFIIFGFVPLISFVFISGTNNQLVTAYISSVVTVILLGSLRWYLTRENYLRAVLETLSIGVIAALIAFGVGQLLS